MPGDGAGFLLVTAVECRLGAAGLRVAKLHLKAETFEYVHHCHTGIGEELIDDTGNKNRDAARHDSRLYQGLQ